MTIKYLLHIIAVTGACLTGCTRGGDNVYPDNAVAAVGTACLTADEVRRQVPPGLSPEDSTTLAKAVIRTWIDGQLITKVAAKQVDMTEIDRLTAEYRTELIKSEYRRAMARRADNATFHEDSLLAFYNTHSADFILERPLIKGIYLKVPDDVSNLSTLKKLYKSDKEADVDKLEKAASSAAIHYDYFRDRWVDWELIEKRIPIADETAAREKLSRHQPIEVESQGFVYLLSVSDYLPAGAPMPFEAARPLVRDRLLAQLRKSYDIHLLNDLYNTAVADGTVRLF